ncbi:calaxin isoform X2 [Daktulosphaira vitifoliae]|nr:calaxin isoform X2 [Daktulosphaira vitifoliae]XP_050536859.1 calaxin isoform X2 [Daktulosphaira vitifoliae]XP_050536861.1 calaxin isoform X2 [Daktulosphaira vitifoliae]XP_050536862.1 calaxin isoform X2 [Daktulosphaira vitifoliae]XP_050536863.1 calaxin isoform X2 [Daktulosphaira vitifoliae]XP_050536864.1 calaxin isoform X2 [Daktulosphaira vitifoliae]XP_050536865.1 calaxin isoform X2 [Daktulosphaira vitifoliae]
MSKVKLSGPPNLVENLCKQTRFTKKEIIGLCKLFKKLVTFYSTESTSTVAAMSSSVLISAPTQGFDRLMFREFLQNEFGISTEEILTDRIFCFFDHRNDGVIHEDEWVSGLSVLLRGTQEERIKYTFTIYDLNNDGFISREEIFNLLRNCLVKHPQDEDPDEGVKELVEIVLKKMDRDNDAKLSFEDFSSSVNNQSLLLEAFGQCLPSGESIDKFLNLISHV